ncbi:MAG: outer membrane beta-barrel protein [Bacteroidales bacterium]
MSPKSMLGLEAGYSLSKSKTEDKETGNEISSSRYGGFSISPKYRFIENVLEKFKLYADVKVNFSFIKEDHFNNYNAEEQNLVGNYFNYGLTIDPGILYKFTNHFGVRLDYNLLYLTHQSLTQADESDIDIEDQEGWTYRFNMSFIEWSFGAFFTF